MFSGVRAFVVAATVIIGQTIAAITARVAVICGAQTVDVNVWACSKSGVKLHRQNATTNTHCRIPITARCPTPATSQLSSTPDYSLCKHIIQVWQLCKFYIFILDAPYLKWLILNNFFDFLIFFLMKFS